MSLPGLAPTALRVRGPLPRCHGSILTILLGRASTGCALSSNLRCVSSCLPRIPQRNQSTIRPASFSRHPFRQPYPLPSHRRTITFFSSQRVITLYEDLPKDYKDATGLPFRDDELTSKEAADIFGPNLSAKRATRLLRILHGRRVAGTLDDPSFAVNTGKYTEAQKKKALEYLRHAVPLDEVMNAGLRAQDELEQLEREMRREERKAQLEAERAQTTKQDGVEGETALVAEMPPPPDVEEVYKPDPIYGYSQFDRTRAINTARREHREEVQRLEDERLGRVPASEMEQLSLREYVANQVAEKMAESPRVQRWQKEGMISDLSEPPPLTTWERLGPSMAFGLLVLLGCAALLVLYEPSWEHDDERIFYDISPSAATVGTLLVLNGLVFAAWRVPPLWRFLNTHFVLVHGLPRPASVLFNAFSHQKLSHLAANSFALYYVGVRLHDEIGRGPFLALFLGSAVMGSMASLLWHTVYTTTLGASGATFGVAAAYFWLHWSDSFKILGWPRDPSEGIHGVVVLAFIVALHIAAMLSKGPVSTDYAAHIGGMIGGITGIEAIQYWKGGERSGQLTPATQTTKRVAGDNDTPDESDDTAKTKKPREKLDLWFRSVAKQEDERRS